MDNTVVSAALGLTPMEETDRKTSRLTFWLFLALTLAAMSVLLVARATPALAQTGGSPDSEAVQTDPDGDGDGDGDDDDDEGTDGGETDLSDGTTAGDVSADTQATGDSGKDNSAGTTAGDVSGDTQKTGDSGNDGTRGTTAGDDSGATDQSN